MKWGNPNPVLYNLAATEYGTTANPNDAQLAACNANNGAAIGGNCIFNDITRGDIDVDCAKLPKHKARDCFIPPGDLAGVLSTSNSTLGVAYPSTSGWDFASGLGSVNVTNLVTGWLAGVPTDH